MTHGVYVGVRCHQCHTDRVRRLTHAEVTFWRGAWSGDQDKQLRLDRGDYVWCDTCDRILVSSPRH